MSLRLSIELGPETEIGTTDLGYNVVEFSAGDDDAIGVDLRIDVELMRRAVIDFYRDAKARGRKRDEDPFAEDPSPLAEQVRNMANEARQRLAASDANEKRLATAEHLCASLRRDLIDERERRVAAEDRLRQEVQEEPGPGWLADMERVVAELAVARATLSRERDLTADLRATEREHEAVIQAHIRAHEELAEELEAQHRQTLTKVNEMACEISTAQREAREAIGRTNDEMARRQAAESHAREVSAKAGTQRVAFERLIGTTIEDMTDGLKKIVDAR